MITLTHEQVQALERPKETPHHVLNPETKELFVLMPLVEYARLKADQYDDSPWTDEERDLLRAEACQQLDSFGKTNEF